MVDKYPPALSIKHLNPWGEAELAHGVRTEGKARSGLAKSCCSFQPLDMANLWGFLGLKLICAGGSN